MTLPKPIVRCSGLDQLLLCPASRVLVPLVHNRDSRGSEVTWAGNWCHWEPARRLVDWHGAIHPAGELPPPEVGEGFQPSPLDRWVADYYTERVLEPCSPDMAIEVENELSFDFGDFILSGHQDFFAVNADGSYAVGGDLKRGHIPVEPAEMNWQMTGYLVLMRRRLAETLDRAIYQVIQPLNDPSSGHERVSTVEVRGEELERLEQYLCRAIREAIDDYDTLNSGWIQCRYCPAALQCPAVREDIKAMKMKLTKETLARIQAEPDDEALVEFELGRKHLGGLFDKAKDQLKARVKANGIVSAHGVSFGLKTTNTGRSLETEKAWDRLCDLLPADRAYECMSVSAPTIEKQLAAHLDIPFESKKGYDGKKAYAEHFGDITTNNTAEQLVILK